MRQFFFFTKHNSYGKKHDVYLLHCCLKLWWCNRWFFELIFGTVSDASGLRQGSPASLLPFWPQFFPCCCLSFLLQLPLRLIASQSAHFASGKKRSLQKKSQRIENWFSEDILLLLSHHLIFITFSGVTAHWSLRSRHIGIFGLLVPRIARTVFENHRKSITLHCEQSELRLHFEWTKVN